MNLIEQIARACEHRLMPHSTVDQHKVIGSDERDALWFAGRSWQDITWDDWERHSGALYGFTQEAFVYYLPSVLMLSSQHPDKWFGPADTLLRMLDRSPVVEHWDVFLTTRLVGLRAGEYEVLNEWLLSLANHDGNHYREMLDRAFDTVGLLRKETDRIHGLTRSEDAGSKE